MGRSACCGRGRFLGGGARAGTLFLGLPDRGAADPPGLAAPPPPDDRFAEDLAAQVSAAQVRLEAVLLRLHLPLGTVLGLSVGQEIALPKADVAQVALEGMDGRRVALGRLGQHSGLRAIRLDGVEAPSPGRV